MRLFVAAGIATLGLGEEEKTEESSKVEHIIKTYAGVSKKVRASSDVSCGARLGACLAIA